MDSFFYVPETFGLHIPLIGEVNLVKWLLIAAAVVAVYSFIPNLAGLAASKAASFVVSLLKQLFAGVKSGLKSADEKVAESKQAADGKPAAKSDALINLQGLTEWAVDTGDPAVLDKVTPLFKELQRKVSTAAVASAVAIAMLLSGCSGSEPVDVKQKCGWVGPAPEVNAQGSNNTLRNKAPQYFGK